MFIVLFTIAKAWEQPKCPQTRRQIAKCATDIQYYSATKKNEIVPFAAKGMYLEMILSQTERDYFHMGLGYHLRGI